MTSLVFLKPNGDETVIYCNEHNVSITIEKYWRKRWKLSSVNGPIVGKKELDVFEKVTE